ncbi:hypothetical protein ARZXY2_1891 [Arthrobacter sp. ZXY-2]|nr:hypothetical protein ARZXY2_1891 [Arthrobacter sp. ZXY-2]
MSISLVLLQARLVSWIWVQPTDPARHWAEVIIRSEGDQPRC